MRTVLRPLLLSLALAAAALATQAAPPLSPATQAQLDRAVIDYESGRIDEARDVFEALSRRGVPAADFNLAVMHVKRQLRDASLARAEELLLRAARGGFVRAQLMMGQSLENGLLGRRDLREAHDWYELAAQAGSAEGQLAMGTAHYLGRGRPKDAARAAHWYREAAKAGDVGAAYILASMYEQGDGVEQDLRLARYWYQRAADGGDDAAPYKVRELELRESAS
jgi:TPR repeat protein